jgi:hypothetical protein
MSSNYVGVDAFSPNLSLMTDDDSPSAIVFRLPNERLLDNTVHVRNRVAALERQFLLDEDFCGVEIDATNDLIRTSSGIWSVVTPDSSIAANVDVVVSEANAPGVIRFNSNAADAADYIIVTYGEGGTTSEQLHAGMFAAAGSFLEVRFRLLFGNVDTAFAIGLWEDEIGDVIGGSVAVRAVGCGDGTDFFSMSSADGSGSEETSAIAVPANEWVKVRIRSVDALLDTSDFYDDAGVLLGTITHTTGIVTPDKPLHLGLRLKNTSTLARFVDVDRITVHADVTR